MADFTVDIRDIKFVLFEMLNIEKLFKAERFSDFDREDVTMVLDEAYKFAREEMAPANEPGDRQGCVVENGTVKAPEAYKKPYKLFCENGWMGVNADPQWGGGGMPNIVNTAIDEMMFGANIGLNLAMLLTPGAARLIEAFGTDELKKTYLPNMFSGKWGGTMCLTEPQAGSDVGAAATRAKPEGDHYLISGDKIFITYGDHDLAENVVHLVLARVEGAPKGTKGLSLFCVPKNLPSGEFNDVVCTAIEHKMGINGSPTCQLSFGTDEKCKGWLVGEEGKGMAEMFQMMNEARINVGLQGSALAAASFLAAWDYAKERVQGADMLDHNAPKGSKAAIIKHPDVAMMLMRQKAYADGLRSLVFYAAHCEDMMAISEGEEKERWHGLIEILTPIAKSYASDMGFRVCEWAVQTYGGYGYLQDYPVEQYLRDAKIASIYEGTNGIQAMDLVGRKLAAKGGYNVKVLDQLFGELIEKNSDHPYFKKEIEAFAAARKEWGKTNMVLAGLAMKKQLEAVFLAATNYQYLCGDLVVSYFLLEGAIKAHKLLEPKLKDVGIDFGDEEGMKNAAKENADFRHLHGRMKSAQFFVAHELPNLYARVASVTSNDRSAMAMAWETDD